MNNNENPRKGTLRILSVCAIIFIIIYAIVNIRGVTTVLSSVFSVLSPIIIGFALAYILNPLLRLYEFKVFKKLKNKNAIRAISITLTFITAIVIITAFLWILIPQLITSSKEIISNYDEYINSSVELINSIINKISSNAHSTIHVSPEDLKMWVSNFFTSSGELMSNILEYIAEFGMGLFVGLKNTILGIFIAIYALISKERLLALSHKLGAAFLSQDKLTTVSKYLQYTNKIFSNFIVGTIIDAFIIFLLTFVLLLIFGIHYPLLIATIVGVTNIIPIFGPIIGGISSFFILFLIDPREAFIFLILVIIIQQLDGNVIKLKILGESTGVSSLAVLIAIIVMGEYFGVIGMLIGVPIFAIAGVFITDIANSKLQNKDMSTNIEEYYLKDSMIDPTSIRQPIISRIFFKTARIILKIVHAIRGKNYHMKHKKPKKSSDKDK